MNKLLLLLILLTGEALHSLLPKSEIWDTCSSASWYVIRTSCLKCRALLLWIRHRIYLLLLMSKNLHLRKFYCSPMFHFDSVIWKLFDELEHKHQQLQNWKSQAQNWRLQELFQNNYLHTLEKIRVHIMHSQGMYYSRFPAWYHEVEGNSLL